MHSASSPDALPEFSSDPVIAVVGSGNWWVASDQIGPMVMKRLQGRYDAAVQIHEIGTAAFALLDCLKGQDLMLILDACVMGGAPGDIHVLRPDLNPEPEVNPVPNPDALPLNGPPFHQDNLHQSNLHQIGPMETLMVARQLYPQCLPASLRLILIETEGLETSQMNAVRDRAVAVIDNAVASAKLHCGGIQSG